jgi:hypothetical protein
MAQQALDELSSRQYVGSSPQHYLETSDQVGAGLEVVGLAADGVEKIADIGRISYGLRFTSATGHTVEQFVASGGKTVPMAQDVAPYLVKGTPAEAMNTMGGSLDWSKAAPAARWVGVGAGIGGVAWEGYEVFGPRDTPATAGDYGHLGVSGVMTAIGFTPVGAPVALVWTAADLAAQSYHYTPVYATEYGNVEINGWRAMRATAIDNQERGTRLLMRERPDLSHDEAEALFKARDFARRMELGPK